MQVCVNVCHGPVRVVWRATANSYPKPNPKQNPKLDLIPKLITVATHPDTPPRPHIHTLSLTHLHSLTHPHTRVLIRCALLGGTSRSLPVQARTRARVPMHPHPHPTPPSGLLGQRDWWVGGSLLVLVSAWRRRSRNHGARRTVTTKATDAATAGRSAWRRSLDLTLVTL